METCCTIKDRKTGRLVPFVFNAGQDRYHRDVWESGVSADVNAKTRKYGLSTQRVGLGAHGSMYKQGWEALGVAQSETPAKQMVMQMLKPLFESSWDFFVQIGEDPRYFMPRYNESAFGYVFPDMHSQYRVSWAGARGIGRLISVHDLYCTEVAEWEDEDSLYTLLTSKPPGAQNTRQTVDFNAHSNWLSSPARLVWEGAQKDRDDPDWNGFTPFFIGTDDVPEYYTPEFLDEQRRKMSERRFKLDYPRTPADLYTQRDTAVFQVDHLDAAVERAGGKYLIDILDAEHGRNATDAMLQAGQVRILHGVDTAAGGECGNFQAIVSFGWHDGMWWELCEPLHERLPEDVFAERVDEHFRTYPGIGVVERNVAGAVIVKLKELDTPGVYRHKHRDKSGKQRRQIGFPTTFSTKRNMIREMNQILRDGNIALVTKSLVNEMRDFEWKHKDDGEVKVVPAGAPDLAGFYDDLCLSAMLALQGQDYEQPQRWVA